MDIRRVPHHHCQAEAQPRTAHDGVPQALGPPTPPRPGRGRYRGFKKRSPARLDEVARKKTIAVETIEICFQDEARIGQKNKIPRRWAKRGTRPSAPRDQRTAS